jgi:uncharacterized protein (TIGR02145 family)
MRTRKGFWRSAPKRSQPCGDVETITTSGGDDKITPIRIRVAAIALGIALGLVCGACSTHRSAKDRNGPAFSSSSRMADGKEWTTANLNIDASPSYCYDDAEPNCRRYGRLYTWESAQQVCQLLGEGWRLPTDEEWRNMAKRYGGVSDDSADRGKAAFTALLSGGTSGFNAVLGGNRSDGRYARLEAHGFYWTASENDPGSAPYYNFGQNGQALHRQAEGEKQMAISVRCVRQ